MRMIYPLDFSNLCLPMIWKMNLVIGYIKNQK